ncbi:TRAP transporter large permease subunit [Parvularcula sp. ZS-1/3]|uniref:TRAP transporter large permease subunit n=1 Tax=Parvularcula mediterranea TaxID=2732508 RepID=A0A7Y3W4I1_9PROT|nr:TRAP transporter large permease subunit [Parvularcula mediterranea]NNU15292.1 TRAP transporter large permease subunit [Parvularcula mediterranea]
MLDQAILCFCACATWLDIAMVVVLCACLLAGFPAAFTLAGTALVFALIGLAMGVLDPTFITEPFPIRIFGIIKNQVLLAVPLFVLMGVILERAKVAEELLETTARLFGPLPGGLGIGVMLVGALLAASTGIVGATVVTMGLLSLPTMLRRGYSPALSSGTIAAAGTLGQVIPPSIVLILLGDVMSNAYQEAQISQGIFSPEPVSVGDLFAGALVPGFVLVGLYLLYLTATAILNPKASPAVPAEDRFTFKEGAIAAAKTLPAPILLIIAVLGSILTGVATATEASAIGAAGAFLIAGSKRDVVQGPLRYLAIAGIASAIVLGLLVTQFDLRLGREASAADSFGIVLAMIATGVLGAGLLGSIVAVGRALLWPMLSQTTKVTSMVFTILIGAALFSLVFRGLGGDETVAHALESAPGGTFGALIMVMVVMFLLGFFLDFIEITLVVVPLVAPPLLMAGVDPVWLGVLMAVNLQTSFLTPPFGFALFYLRGVAPPEVPTGAIYRGALPFVGIQIAMLILLALLPELATWLPERIYG